jgi:uncharacterized protein (DUF697 family)
MHILRICGKMDYMETINTQHYYGDRIRTFFLVTGILMVITLPYFNSIVHVPVAISLIAILGLAILGGFLNPSQRWVIITDTIVSILGFAAFEYYAIQTYIKVTPDAHMSIIFYWINQIFALLFFLSVYLCVKTLRGNILRK